MSFDLLEHHRRRTRLAEGRALRFEVEHERLLRLLALTVYVASARSGVEPSRLLRFLDAALSSSENAESELDRLAQLLRETDPAQIAARAAA